MSQFDKGPGKALLSNTNKNHNQSQHQGSKGVLCFGDFHLDKANESYPPQLRSSGRNNSYIWLYCALDSSTRRNDEKVTRLNHEVGGRNRNFEISHSHRHKKTPNLAVGGFSFQVFTYLLGHVHHEAL